MGGLSKKTDASLLQSYFATFGSVQQVRAMGTAAAEESRIVRVASRLSVGHGLWIETAVETSSGIRIEKMR